MVPKIICSLLICSLITTTHMMGMEGMRSILTDLEITQGIFQPYTTTARQASALEYAKRKIQEDPNILYDACKNGDLGQVKLIAVAAEIINNKDQNGHVPLHFAVERGHLAVVKVLIERGAIINAQDNNGYTPLHMACQNGHKEVVQYLVEQGAGVNIQNNKNWTPLDPESADYAALEKAGAVIRTVTLADGTQGRELLSGGGISPLHLACRNNHKDIVDILIKHGAQVDVCTHSGHMPLHTACRYGHVELVKFMVLESFFPISKASINRKASLQEQCLIKILNDAKSINDAVAHDIARIFSLKLEHDNFTKIIANHAPLKLQHMMVDYWKKNECKENVNKQKHLLEIHCNRYFAHLKNILTKKELPVSKSEFAQQAIPRFKEQLITWNTSMSDIGFNLLIDQAYIQHIQYPPTTPLIVELAQQLKNNDVLALVAHIVNTARSMRLSKTSNKLS